MTKKRPIILNATCPFCASAEVVRLPHDWQKLVEEGARVAIIGCGNPWHYANFEQVPAPATIRRPAFGPDGET